jgi:hypothetical protein
VIGGQEIIQKFPEVLDSAFFVGGADWLLAVFRYPILDQQMFILKSVSFASGQINLLTFWVNLSTLNLSISYFSEGLVVPVPVSELSASYDDGAATSDPTFSAQSWSRAAASASILMRPALMGQKRRPPVSSFR